MSIWKKLFGSDELAESGKLSPTTEMLAEDLYWEIVDESLEKSRNQDDQEQFLISRLGRLTPTEIIGFRLRTDKLLFDTYNSAMWCAGYIMNGGCSDDAFEYFRNWVISRGKDVYYKAKANPDSLIAERDDDLDYYEFESFWYVGLEAFKNKTGKDLYDFVPATFEFSEGKYPQFDFTWEEDNPETMRAICPNLFDKMWN